MKSNGDLEFASGEQAGQTAQAPAFADGNGLLGDATFGSTPGFEEPTEQAPTQDSSDAKAPLSVPLPDRPLQTVTLNQQHESVFSLYQ